MMHDADRPHNLGPVQASNRESQPTYWVKYSAWSLVTEVSSLSTGCETHLQRERGVRRPVAGEVRELDGEVRGVADERDRPQHLPRKREYVGE